MGVLNSWQRIDRVLPGKPFGDGLDGNYSSATIPSINHKSCSGSSGSKTLSASTSSPYSVGDVVLIHQSRGSGAGQFEINRIESVGSGVYTLQEELHYNHIDSGASQAQVVKVFRYRDVTIQSGTWNIPTWNGNIYGLFAMAFNGEITRTGSISGNGDGYQGGLNRQDPTPGDNGEGANANPGSSGYGAGVSGGAARTGPGGGYGTAGTQGSDPGTPGASYGLSDLTLATFGGGGAGAGANPGSDAGKGGRSGALTIIYGKHFNAPTGTITTNGEDGYDGVSRGGGGGSGGAQLYVVQSGSFGTNKSTSVGGDRGNTNGGYGGDGRIAIHHSGEVTGTTNPTFTDVEDPTLVESGGNFFAVL